MEPQTDGLALDLDALAPSKIQINYGGQIIDIKPVDLPTFSKMLVISSDLSKLQDSEDPNVFTPIYESIRNLISEAIPELADKTLNIAQLMSTFKFLNEVCMPQDKALKELEKQGITVSEDAGPKVLTS